VSIREFVAVLVTTLTVGGAILISGPPASARAPGPGAQSTPDGRQVLPAPSTEQLARRDAFARRAGLDSAALNGPRHLINYHSRKCLTIYGASTANNANAVQYDCENQSPFNEDWYLEDVYGDGSWYMLRNGNALNKCLTVYGASTANNANVVQYDCDYSYPFNEQWEAKIVGYNARDFITNVKFRNRNNSSMCLTVYGASTANNANAVQYACDTDYPYNDVWIWQGWIAPPT